MKQKREVIEGEKFGRLTVIKQVESRRNYRMVLCSCECGVEKVVWFSAIIGGLTKSCGCFNMESLKSRKHKPINKGRKIVHLGDRFGRWTFLNEEDKVGKFRMMKVKCDCGVEKIISYSSLKYGLSKSCGCLSEELKKERSTIHGETVGRKLTAEYKTWESMLKRCYNENDHTYKNYGAKGVKVCDEWRKNYAQFLNDVGRKPTPNHSIDRYPNNKGNYEKGNVRWATSIEQVRNRTVTRFVEHLGKNKALAEWAEIYKTSYKLFWKRLKKCGGDMEILISKYYNNNYANI